MDAPGCLTLGQASRSSYSNFPPLMSIHNFDTEFRQFLDVRSVVRSNRGILKGICVVSEELSAVETIGGVAQQPGMFVARGITSATKGIPLGKVWFPSRQWQFTLLKRVGVALAITLGVTGDFRPSSRGQWGIGRQPAMGQQLKARSSALPSAEGRPCFQAVAPGAWIPPGLPIHRSGQIRQSGIRPGGLVAGFSLPSRGGGMSDGRYHRFVQ